MSFVILKLKALVLIAWGLKKVCWLCSLHFLFLVTSNITLRVLEMLRFIFCVHSNIRLFSNMNV